MKQFNYETGKLGERLAAAYLVKRGYKILERNWQTRQGEIDLIATRSTDSGQAKLVFVEVKLKIGEDFGSPEEMINPAKIAKLEKMASFYVLQNPETARKFPIFSLDAICLVLDENRRVKRISYYENINL